MGPGYEPNFFDLLVSGTDDEAKAKAQALASQLRGDRVMGQMALGGGRLAAPIGKDMLGDVDQAEKGLLTAGVNRLHYGQQAQDLKARLEQMKSDRALEVQRLKALTSGPGSPKDMKDEAMANEKIRLALDPNGPRAGNYGNYAKRLAMVNEVDRLLKQFPNPTKAQWYEIARAFDTAISMGGSTISGTQHLIPNTLHGKAEEMGNFLFNQAEGMGADAFHKLLSEAVAGQQKYWSDQVGGIANQRVGSLSPYFQRYPDSTAITLEGLGHDPASIQSHPYAKKARTAGPGGAGAGGGGKPPTVNSKAEFDALPKGTTYFNARTQSIEVKG